MYKIPILIFELLFVSIILLLFYIKKQTRDNNGFVYKNNEKLINLKYELLASEELERLCTELKEKDKQINFLTYNDSLTKLPNKKYLVEKLKCLISSEANINKGVIFFINIGKFKNINTVYGYDYGDKILSVISDVLKIILPQDCTLCRGYGDEFLIIFENLEEENEVLSIAENIIDYFKKPFEIYQKPIYITISIGISRYPNDSCDIDDIINNAEVAMHKSKNKGKNQYTLYNDELQNNIFRRNNIRRYIGNAIYNNELYLNYQPQYDIKTENIIGYEALLRWNNKDLGQVLPMEFIPIVEEDGLILVIGDWVLRNACLQNSKWISLGFYNVIAVNISAIQFDQDNFIQTVKEILSETKLLPQFLELEITETALIKSLEKSIKTIEKLKELGVKVSLDDFGTGYSSLSYLKKLPIDNLKVDKSFIDDIVTSENSNSILHTIIQLAHTLNLKVVAEGIEKIEQSEILKEKKCDIAQGYYYSKPISGEEIENILNS